MRDLVHIMYQIAHSCGARKTPLGRMTLRCRIWYINYTKPSIAIVQISLRYAIWYKTCTR